MNDTHEHNAAAGEKKSSGTSFLFGLISGVVLAAAYLALFVDPGFAL